jgi:hypothetical protein
MVGRVGSVLEQISVRSEALLSEVYLRLSDWIDSRHAYDIAKSRLPKRFRPLSDGIIDLASAENCVRKEARLAARDWHKSAQMKKEVLKGFSLLALIIMLALMTAVASVSANAPGSEDQSYAADAR